MINVNELTAITAWLCCKNELMKVWKSDKNEKFEYSIYGRAPVQQMRWWLHYYFPLYYFIGKQPIHRLRLDSDNSGCWWNVPIMYTHAYRIPVQRNRDIAEKRMRRFKLQFCSV